MLAPLAFKVAVLPEQITAEFTLTVGLALTLTVATAVLEQPAVVPVTVYVVVADGEIISGLLVLPVFHKYVAPPVAVNVAFFPEHIKEEFTVIVGFGLTATSAVAAFEQPVVLPITV